MPTLLIVGGGLFGSPAAAYARRKGIEAIVFDAGLERAASPAAAGLFREDWTGKRLHHYYRPGLSLLEELYGVQSLSLARDDDGWETFLFVPPRLVLEPAPVRQRVTAIGDGWLEAGGRRYQGWVYVAAGVWCEQFYPGLGVHGRAGACLLFAGERPGRLRPLGPGRQAVAFVRDPGTTYFSDGTAERNYTTDHDRRTLARALAWGLTEQPVARFVGNRPYAPGGPLFRQIAGRTWLATGGRKLGTLLGAAFARQLVEQELRFSP
jgi:hypothetical protein